MDWEHLRHFSAFAQHGSLAAAARLLGVEHATVARRIAALEAALEVKLVDRRGRRITLTAEGEAIAAIAGRMGADAEAVRRAAAGTRADLSGRVVVSAPPAFAAARLAGPLAVLQRQHPKLVVQVIGETRNAALERREADIAVRLSRPETGDYSIVRLGQMAFRLYAGPAYLAATPAEDWVFIGYGPVLSRVPQEDWLSTQAGSRPFAFTATTAEIQLAAARAGAGIAALPDFLAEGHPDLVRVRPEDPPFLRDLWLVVHSDLKDAAPVRAVVETLKAAVAGT